MEWGHGATKTSESRRGKHVNADKMSFSTEEICGNGRVTLLLRPSAPAMLDAIASAARQLHRLAGGSMWDIQVDILQEQSPVPASWLADSTRRVRFELSNKPGVDSLGVAMAAYGAGGEWTSEGRWVQPRNTHTLNMTGYAYLSEPAENSIARDNYPFAWCEAVHALVAQSSFPGWWRRESHPWGIVWRGV